VKKNSPISQDSDILKPTNEIELSEIIRNHYKKNLPTTVVGSNSKNFIGYKPQTAKTISLENFNGIIEYLPEELYIKVKPGTPISLVEDTLEKKNQELAFEVIDLGYIKNGVSNKGTVGGQVSCNLAGSRRFKVGSIRDHILGFRAINGKGEIIKSGGTVVKNVTGYDLSKLITGSYGTLVALTEIVLKASPKKESQSTVIINESKIKKVSELLDKILSSSNEVSGAVFIPNEPDNEKFTINKRKIFKFNDLRNDGPFIAFRIEGDKESIQERYLELKKELDLKNYDTSYLDSFQSVPFWKKINNIELFSYSKNNIIKAVIPPSYNSDLMEYLENKYKYYIDWCGSLFWIEIIDGKNEKIKLLKEKVDMMGGYLTIIKKSENFSYDMDLFSKEKVKLDLSKKIKQSFDPKRILNPGKMYREI
tara:strand:+ start:13943 stop:15208 length:1266 start_codon:yes stop_codon:yes gene_type:complete